MIASYIPKDKGKIIYKKKKVMKEEVTLILQHPFFLGDLSIKNNLKIGAIFRGGYNRKIVQKWAKTLQIEHVLKRKANVVSGGEKARANILRGIIEEKDIILVDEPTAHLDLENSKIVAKLLSELSSNKIVIVTTHQPQLFNFSNTIFIRIKEGTFHEDNNLI